MNAVKHTTFLTHGTFMRTWEPRFFEHNAAASGKYKKFYWLKEEEASVTPSILRDICIHVSDYVDMYYFCTHVPSNVANNMLRSIQSPKG